MRQYCLAMKVDSGYLKYVSENGVIVKERWRGAVAVVGGTGSYTCLSDAEPGSGKRSNDPVLILWPPPNEAVDGCGPSQQDASRSRCSV